MSRKLNAVEQRLHQTALASANQTILEQDVNDLVPDVSVRTAAVNFLLGAGMLKAKQDGKGAVVAYRVVLKQELDVKKDMSGEEAMVLSYIQAAGNEGIWTKHLKAKTELHQTVIDRILKSLLQKTLIKVVKSVKHPTRKIYMLANLNPSVEMTGGPWFTDNELDTEFIKLLLEACAHYIRERTFPKESSSTSSSRPLYPPSRPPSYPTARQIQSFLSKSKITETELSVEHVEMLCGVLILDGLIERVPLFSAGSGNALWDGDGGVSGDENGSRKRLRREKREDNERKVKRQRHTRASRLESDSESGSGDSEAGARSSSKVKRSVVKRRKSTDDDSDGAEKRRKKKRRGHESESDEASDRKKSSRRSDKKGKGKRDRSLSPLPASDESEAEALNVQPVNFQELDPGMSHAYRAIRAEQPASVMGWSRAPCGRCPVFDFCKDGGPVNPRECVYFDGMEPQPKVEVES